MSNTQSGWKPWVMDSLYEADETSAPSSLTSDVSSSFQHEAELQMIKQKAHDDAFEAGFSAGIKTGHQKGYTQGYEKGEQAAREEVMQQATQQFAPLADVANQFSDAVSALDLVMVEQIAQMALRIGTALARRQLDIAPETVCDLVTDLMGPDNEPLSKPVLWLNPDDVELVSDHLKDALKNSEWTISPDASVSRGGCRVTSKTGEIDAQFETRVSNMVKGLFS